MPLDFTPASSQHVDIGLDIPSLNGKPAVTIMAWIKLDDSTATRSVSEQAIGPPPGTSGTSRMFFNVTAGGVGTAGFQLGIRPADGGGSTTLNSSGSPITDGQWHHIAAVGDIGGDAMALYIDGVLNNSSAPAFTPTTFPATNGKNGTVGANDTGGGQFFNGVIDDYRMYDRALSADEIATIYAARGVDGIAKGLVQGWRMSEGAPGVAAVAAGSVKDSSPAQRNIDPINSPVYETGVIRSRRKVA